MIMITPLPGVTATKPGSATFPFPGIARRRHRRRRAIRCRSAAAATWSSSGRGRRCCAGIYGDPERYKETYWSRFPGMYFAGDGAKRDAEGYLWLLGRVDDVMNVSGHRISTIEVESALVVDHPSVAEAAVVGETGPDHRPGDLRVRHPARLGVEATRRPGRRAARARRDEVIGPIAKPKFLMFTPDLPKTRSGKIMRRLLRDIAEGRTLGDTTTLADTTVVETIRSNTGSAEE